MIPRNYRSEDDNRRVRVSEEFFICRKVNYGNNGNFTRYVPVNPQSLDRKSFLMRLVKALVQANGCTQSEAHQLVDYVYGRAIGEINQEVGGVMVTLAALCLASGVDMHEGGEVELVRIWQCVDKIRAKQAAKPKHSPLPE